MLLATLRRSVVLLLFQQFFDEGLTLLYASDAGKHITGQWLAVDGGVSAVVGA